MVKRQASDTSDVPHTIRISRGVVATQGAGIGCGGLMALFLGFLTVVSGAEWISLGLGVIALGLLLMSFALLCWLLVVKLGSVRDRWRLVVVLFELALVPIGVSLARFGDYAMMHAGTPQNPGTDGPFADGSEGLIWLVGCAFVLGGAVVVALLIWEQVLAAFDARSSRSRSRGVG